jgi:hypoxanthine phosphoribosyltransferase
VFFVNKDVERILVSEEELDAIVTRLAAEIDRDYAGSDKRLVLVCILKGSIVFMGDLMKKLSVPCEIECMKVSSYGAGTTSTGSIDIRLDLTRSDLDACDLLLVEDIIDSGNTLSYLVNYLKQKGAKTVRTCTLLDKPSRRKVEFFPDYCGKVIPDEFVIGYGLDYAEKYRDLPFVGILSPSVYADK